MNSNVKIVVENISGTQLGEFTKARDISHTRFINSVGELVFRISKDDPKFSLLSGLKTHLSVYDEGTRVWRGVFDFYREDKNDFVIFASTFESLLDYYLVDPTAIGTSSVRTFTAKKIGTQIADVLFDEAVAKSNSLLSAFTQGTIQNPYEEGTTTEMVVNMEFNFETVFQAIAYCAAAGGADFEITFNKQFNFLRRKGSNKDNVVLYFRKGEISNLRDYQREVDYRRISNKLYAFGVGYGANYLKSSITDATSQSTYGLLEGSLGMPKVLVDQDTLDKAVADQIEVTKEPSEIVSPIVVPARIGLYDGWDLGDNIYIDIEDGQTDIYAQRRIVGVQVNYTNEKARSVYTYLDLPRDA